MGNTPTWVLWVGLLCSVAMLTAHLGRMISGQHLDVFTALVFAAGVMIFGVRLVERLRGGR